MKTQTKKTQARNLAIKKNIAEEEREMFLQAFFTGKIGATDENKIINNERDLFLNAFERGFLPPSDDEFTKRKNTKNKAKARKKVDIDAVIDLHGMHAEEAVNALYGFIEREKSRGAKTLLVIHGKGAGILKSAAFSIAETHPSIDDYKQAPGRYGGDGALFLKINQRKKK